MWYPARGMARFPNGYERHRLSPNVAHIATFRESLGDLPDFGRQKSYASLGYVTVNSMSP